MTKLYLHHPTCSEHDTFTRYKSCNSGIKECFFITDLHFFSYKHNVIEYSIIRSLADMGYNTVCVWVDKAPLLHASILFLLVQCLYANFSCTELLSPFSINSLYISFNSVSDHIANYCLATGELTTYRSRPSLECHI